MQIASDPQSYTVLEAMRADHVALERCFRGLLTCAHADDPEGLRAAFHELEEDLKAHMDKEEHALLPRYEAVCPGQTATIRKQHAAIRAELERLGLDLDLHALREESVERLVSLLREHAAHEEAQLYKWADAALGEHEKWPLLKWFAARVEDRLASSRSSRRG